MKDINLDNLYVVSPVIINDILIEPFIQYESFGKEHHEITVDPKKVLVVKEDIDGKEVYKDAFNGSEVKIVNYESSYESESRNSSTLYSTNLQILSNHPFLPIPLKKETINYYKGNNGLYGYPIPFADYIERVFGIKIFRMKIQDDLIVPSPCFHIPVTRDRYNTFSKA